MITRLATVTIVALFSLSGPQSPQDEIAALRKEIADLKASQAAMQRDLEAIKNFLQAVAQGRQPGESLENASVVVAGEPSKGSPTAKVTMVEVSDYHCPYCRRHAVQTQPQIDAEYIKTGKVQYVFVDYPIAQLHPNASRAHEAANCAGEQGKYWEMHTQLFAKPTQDPAALNGQAGAIGLDTSRFSACMDSRKYQQTVQQSVERMQKLGVDSTPTFLLGLTPSGNQPMKVVRVLRGALPYDRFKTTIDGLLQ